MITFMPYPTYKDSLESLDDRRLGKQRVETLQIAYGILEIGPDFEPRDSAWRRHPATQLWWGNLRALLAYGIQCSLVWKSRGFTDNTLQSFVNIQDNLRWIDTDYDIQHDKVTKPVWMGWEPLHENHRANLVRKDPDYYSDRFMDTAPATGYLWLKDFLEANRGSNSAS